MFMIYARIYVTHSGYPPYYIAKMSSVLNALKHHYPVWLQSCDSYILYLVPEHIRFYDERDSVYVTWPWGILLTTVSIGTLIGIALYTKRIVDIARNHF